MRRIALFCMVMMGCLWALACGSGGTNTPTDEGEYRLTATLSPDPPKVGQHSMELHVTDKSGQKLSGARLTVYPHMPHHGHGSTEDPVVSEMGDGAYKATPITFQMPGHWEINVTVEIDGKKEMKTLIYQVR